VTISNQGGDEKRARIDQLIALAPTGLVTSRVRRNTADDERKSLRDFSADDHRILVESYDCLIELYSALNPLLSDVVRLGQLIDRFATSD
jgi:hypothetical protein